jgi:hypothetical protein
VGGVAGGPLVDWLGWRVGLIAHVPLALVALSCARSIDESRGAARPADYPGAIAIAAAIGFAIAYGTIGPTAGWAAHAWFEDEPARRPFECKSARLPVLLVGLIKVRGGAP